MNKIQIFENDIPSNIILQGDLALDTETMGLNLSRDRLCLIQISDNVGNTILIKFDGKDYNAPNLAKLLSETSREIIFHYARFDVAVIKKYLNIDIKNIFCTKIASKLVRTYTDFHGLKELCRELLDTQISKQQQSSDWGSNILSKDQVAYAAGDVIYLHQIRKKLEAMLIRENRLELAQKLFKFLPTRVGLDLLGFENDIFAHQ